MTLTKRRKHREGQGHLKGDGHYTVGDRWQSTQRSQLTKTTRHIELDVTASERDAILAQVACSVLHAATTQR